MGFTKEKSTRYQGRITEIQEWGYQISNGPGPRPWTRPAPYIRRTITSYPRTSIFPTPIFNRYSPYKRQTSPKKIWELPKVMDKDFVMQKFMTSVQAFHDDTRMITAPSHLWILSLMDHFPQNHHHYWPWHQLPHQPQHQAQLR